MSIPRIAVAAYKGFELARRGRPRLAIQVGWYHCWWRLSRLDFGPSTVEALNLPSNRARGHKLGGGPLLSDVVGRLRISSSDAVLDLGCGKGAALVTLAAFPFAHVDGVEISPSLAAVARSNLARVRLDRCRIFVGDAAAFKGLERYTHFFMFNPFPAQVLREVLANLGTSLQRRPRRAVVIYSNPVHGDVMHSTAGFVETARYEPYTGYVTAVYENVG